ncbi:centrosomal protein of 126 kDa isoform X2 [Clarias gariepinus]|uniref:centrosomal protein of 126 kDa isoform X2 n=1 Tax=Clarias gariepinus TaxID=13013 RepID=UPI00234C6534|nr:centrosomal protein of 126 kDa isoform X2 [Clarias gariepinus]
MQVAKDTLYYSNLNAEMGEEPGDDRQLLVQEQKACRARARQYSLETNRRRKALEERRRQLDVQEQRLRENILQERKQRLQEATDRYLRAHLLPSQRRRPASCTKTPNLEEALSHIQGDQTPSSQDSSFLSNTSTSSRSCIPSPKPPGGPSGPRSLRTFSAPQAYAKLVQERSLGDFKTNQQLFINQLQENLLNNQEQVQKQEHSDPQFSHAESLSSLDSLENEVPQHGHDSKHNSLDPSEVHNTICSTSLKRQLNCPGPPESLLETVVSVSSSSSSSTSTAVEDESADEVLNLLKTPKQGKVTCQSKASNIQATTSCQKQVFTTNLGPTEYQNHKTAQENLQMDKTIGAENCRLQTAPDTMPQEYSCMAQQCSTESNKLSLCTKLLSDIQAASKASSASDLNKVSPSLGNSSLQPEKSFHSSKRKLDENGVPFHDRRTQFKSFQNYESAGTPNLSDKYSDRRLANEILPSTIAEEPDKMSTDTLTNYNNIKSSNVQFLKGILKKKIKRIGDVDPKFSYTPGHFTFSKQVAVAIRDSLELSRTKDRDAESNKCIQKKLRWIDEVLNEGRANKEMVTKELNMQAENERRLTQMPLVDAQQGSFHSWYMNLSSGKPKNKTSSCPDDPNLTKQAWSDVGSQKGKQQEATIESRMEKAAPSTTGLCIPQQEHLYRTGTGTISTQARRGTIIRPQSSGQLQHVVRTQGKVLVPRPPPRSKVTARNTGQGMMYINKTGSSEYSQDKALLPMEQVLYKDCPDGQSLPQRHILKRQESTILGPVQPSYACMYETVSKGIYTLCQSDGQAGSGRKNFQNGILERTPTDEEISQLWHGVRSALAGEEGDSHSLQTHKGPLFGLPQTHADLSHVTINGDSLFGGVKAAAASVGGFFLSSSNVRNPVRRPTLDNNMVKNRPAALGYRNPPVLYQAKVPITASKSDQTVHDQDSDVIDGAKKVAVAPAHFQKAAEFLQSQQGLSALSLEEQQILQSLDRLNHHLQYVQDVALGNTALNGTVAVDPAFNQSPQPDERKCATLSRYHSGAVDSRTRPHRRY